MSIYQGFHKSYNLHALQHITKSVEVPHAALGVGEGEHLAALKNVVKYPTIQKQVIQPDISNKSVEQTQIDGYADPIKPEDFPRTLYFGDPIGVI